MFAKIVSSIMMIFLSSCVCVASALGGKDSEFFVILLLACLIDGGFMYLIWM